MAQLFFFVLILCLPSRTLQKSHNYKSLEGDIVIFSHPLPINSTRYVNGSHITMVQTWLKVINMGQHKGSTIHPLMLSKGLSLLELDIKTGDRVNIEFDIDSNMDMCVKEIKKVNAMDILGTRDGGEIGSVAFFFRQVCDTVNNVAFDDFVKHWHGGPGTSWNMPDYYSDCSLGKFNFTPTNNIIIGPIDVPCDVVNQYGGVHQGACDASLLNALMDYGASFSQTQGILIDNFRQRIASLPQINCGWGGLGTIGCSSFCNAWIINYADHMKLSTYFHELGHNLGLMHANKDGIEYGDGSCAMGMSGEGTCFNAPHSWVLGWSAPSVEYDMSNAPYGGWVSNKLYNRNFIRIVPNWGNLESTGTERSIFVSFRTSQGYDMMMNDVYSHKLLIHDGKGEPGLPEISPTNLLSIGEINFGNKYILQNGINFIVSETNSLFIVVSLCVSTANQSC